MRTARIARKTNETDITLTICLDGRGVSAIQSGVGFLDHMLTLLARHGRLDLELTCRGDTQVDDHHSVEDIGIALGDAVAQALGEKRGVRRYASLHLPMDEALILCAVDLSGRGGYYDALDIPAQKIGRFDTELVYEFMNAFAVHAGLTLHLRRAATPTTSWRGPSRPWAGPCGRRRPLIQRAGTKFHPQRGCFDHAGAAEPAL